MSPKQSTARLCIYIALAMLASLLPDLETIRRAIVGGQLVLWIDWLIISVKAATAGGIVARAYIDQTPTQVDKP